MIEFILNNQTIETDLPPGTTVLDFVRYRKNLKGTKIGCREGDCGACTVLVGELSGDELKYRSMTSCLMPLANAQGKHIVTIEGINPENGDLTPVQQAMVDESGTQCGFCTVGFVMSLTGFCIDETEKTPEMAVSSVDGNICRCTGYKSIERVAINVAKQAEPPASAGGINAAIKNHVIPEYFDDIVDRLSDLLTQSIGDQLGPDHPLTQAVLTRFVGGGTDVYVQKPDELRHSSANHLFYDNELRGIRDTGNFIEIGASATVTDLLVSPLMQEMFPDLYKHLKLVSSTPIRNMATLAGNFVNASPIGDMTVWFLALDATIILSSPPYKGGVAEGRGGSLLSVPTGIAGEDLQKPARSKGEMRTLALRDLFLGYKQLAKSDDEFIKTIRFKKPSGDFRFNFEKVCKRTYLDIATVNMAISLSVPPAVTGGLSSPPYKGGVDLAPLLPEEGCPKGGVVGGRGGSLSRAVQYIIAEAHVAAAGGVAPIPLYLKETSAFLNGREVNKETITQANEIMQSEISPISDVRGSADYKLLRQLFKAHFVELFGSDAV